MSTASERRFADLSRLRRIRDRIDREFDQPLDVSELARAEHLSTGHLSRQFLLAYGESVYSYLMTRRVERAMTLLRNSQLSVTDICTKVGYASLGTFSTRFRELVGVSPTEYRACMAEAEIDGVSACVRRRVARPIRNREALPWSAQ